MLAFLGALGQAGGLVIGKHGMGQYDAFAATQIRILAGTVGFAVLLTMLSWWPQVMRGLRHHGGLAYSFVGALFGPCVGVSFSLLAAYLMR